MSEVFVFGSNLMGRHGKGAALYAKQHYGAIEGRGEGRQGNAYAIPTKETPYKSLPLIGINCGVADFLSYAACAEEYEPDLTFIVTRIGCGLAGYKPEDIAPMFRLAKTLKNVTLPPEFLEFLSD